MARLKSPDSDLTVQLFPRHLIGRSSQADLTVHDRLCSSRHCEVRWRDNRWCVRDLNSRNGTWVDGRQIPPQSIEVLSAGKRIAFGNPSEPWEILDIEPPTAVLVAPDGSALFAEDGLLHAPSADRSSRLLINLTKDGTWMIERASGSPEPAPAESTISVGGQPWRLLCPVVQPETERFVPRRDLDALALRFHVTEDGKNCRIEALIDGVVAPLDSRTHDRLLLHLARARLAAPGEGWVHRDALWPVLQIDEPEINVWIYRIRRHFNGLGFQGSGRLIERQQGDGLIRLGVDRLEIIEPR